MNQKQSIALIDSSLRMTAELSVTVARESSGAIFEAALLIYGVPEKWRQSALLR
jgi:hypothetical protein